MSAQELELDLVRQRQHIEFFKVQTENRIVELEAKLSDETITRAETFELDMCRADVKRAERHLNGTK